MKSVMISQPMSGYTVEQIKEIRKDVAQMLEKQEYYVMDTIIKNLDHNARTIDYLVVSLGFLANADCVFFMDGWEKSKGCRIEHLVATQYGKEVMYENIDSMI